MTGLSCAWPVSLMHALKRRCAMDDVGYSRMNSGVTSCSLDCGLRIEAAELPERTMLPLWRHYDSMRCLIIVVDASSADMRAHRLDPSAQRTSGEVLQDSIAVTVRGISGSLLIQALKIPLEAQIVELSAAVTEHLQLGTGSTCSLIHLGEVLCRDVRVADAGLEDGAEVTAVIEAVESVEQERKQLEWIEQLLDIFSKPLALNVLIVGAHADCPGAIGLVEMQQVFSHLRLRVGDMRCTMLGRSENIISLDGDLEWLRAACMRV